MPAQIIDGKAIAEAIRNELKAEVAALKETRSGKVPGLAAVIVGQRKDSQKYVQLKHKAAAEVGMASFNVELPEDVSQAVLEASVEELNQNPNCHGIIIQLPLPKHLDENKAIEKIHPDKDADALLPVNVGLLHCKGREPLFTPCTAKGVVVLLQRCGIAMKGKRAVVLGRSNIVGAPVAALLMKENATVTVVHSGTAQADMVDYLSKADIVIAAMGQPGYVQGEWIKEGAAVVDVGTTPVNDPTKKAGYRLVGDVCFEEAAARAAWISPVPGGVGPMTIAMLLHNTLSGFKLSVGEL
ncbi:putative C-1-tetrahydrofolate synthase cytoplasmic [Leptomonas pyrrhocoris]|uniref:Putative C-1-tetrahydrofolate synthase cytoplasmic n=1 Tax=Leptomonas pyrrhocoris TaxID=157538 RepID=A0A0M9GBH5_LEPPY|nr:putative C-1-tetrahydrofolate synthase cytoplasmic [Leptomonas pyrrhocoris]XP_015665175.1 putative C-1-tetrahydrofolate synthase cytoplasmic [Leptomonas pyrrhocoris]XP_015665176.1 putative C-1-tetrahydrofolate synthase cytoplasmic [Leptomonas pyrrhocoris]KPA86735.1 putative C-1-tetrahydrofolate synthase cytoplasmic [Leptomonas pyrrhocoris]KPA86736.1 putative C-1-tetrahydrofolate synthase cytoplasmic [Leptomonas pyrrhocoris]KPA86737.1 putative C-1-tetrahydrofolate synthase cytoplasmic [Lepto|eukprot:XP_015665174.1 putative C-1-tetrahydrofolate synthase cytoplasmic [Leptomonas pyrrhocoris]